MMFYDDHCPECRDRAQNEGRRSHTPEPADLHEPTDKGMAINGESDMDTGEADVDTGESDVDTGEPDVAFLCESTKYLGFTVALRRLRRSALGHQVACRAPSCLRITRWVPSLVLIFCWDVRWSLALWLWIRCFPTH